MLKQPLVRKLMDSQHVEGSERPLKSAREYFCHFFFITMKQNELQNNCFTSI